MRLGSLEALRKYLNQASENEQAPLYLVVGEVDSSLVKEVTQGHPLRILDGKEVSGRELSDALESGSLFGTERALHIRAADKLSAGAKEVLKRYCMRPNPQVRVLLESGKDLGLMRMVESKGVVVDLLGAPPWEREKQLVVWLEQQAKERRKRLEPAAIRCLLEYCEDDRALLARELEKLCSYVGERSTIGVRDVQAVSVASRQVRAWALGQAILERNVSRAMEALRQILEKGDIAPHGILVQLRTQMDTAYQLASAQGDLARMFPQFRGRRLEHERTRSLKYGLDRYKRAIMVLAEADLSARSRTVNLPLLLEGVVARLVS